MKKIILLFVTTIMVCACGDKETAKYSLQQADWKTKETKIDNVNEYSQRKSYLPVYSPIYHIHERRSFDLTTKVSIRNISIENSIFILKADYNNTIGKKVRQYVKNPIYLSPLETLEIVISEQDIEGGSGANLVFDWATTNDKSPPLFKAEIISTYSQQGLSFFNGGVQIFE